MATIYWNANKFVLKSFRTMQSHRTVWYQVFEAQTRYLFVSYQNFKILVSIVIINNSGGLFLLLGI